MGNRLAFVPTYFQAEIAVARFEAQKQYLIFEAMPLSLGVSVVWYCH